MQLFRILLSLDFTNSSCATLSNFLAFSAVTVSVESDFSGGGLNPSNRIRFLAMSIAFNLWTRFSPSFGEKAGWKPARLWRKRRKMALSPGSGAMSGAVTLGGIRAWTEEEDMRQLVCVWDEILVMLRRRWAKSLLNAMDVQKRENGRDGESLKANNWIRLRLGGKTVKWPVNI